MPNDKSQMTNEKTSGYELAALRAMQRARKGVTDDGEVPAQSTLLTELAAVYATLELAEAIRGSAKVKPREIEASEGGDSQDLSDD